MTPVIQKCSPVLPPSDIPTVLRYARGIPDAATEALLREIVREAESALDPRICYLDCPVTVTGDRVDFGCCQVESRDLAAHLQGYRRAILFAATIGAKADRLLTRFSTLSPAKELLADAYFSERIEALCDRFTARFNDPDRRFSPGYGDLPLEFQTVLFRVLDCPRNIGLTLGETLLMIPTKSVTAVIGRKEE